MSLKSRVGRCSSRPPVLPLGHHGIHQGRHLVVLQPHLGGGLVQGRHPLPAPGRIQGQQQAHLGGEMQGGGEGLGAGAGRERRLAGELVMAHGLVEDVRQAPVLQQFPREGGVVQAELGGLGLAQGRALELQRQQFAVFQGKRRGQGQPADAGQQPAGEALVRRALGLGGHLLGGDAGGQGRRPVAQVVEGGAGAAAVMVDEGKPQGDLAHPEQAQENDGMGQGGDMAQAAAVHRVGVAQDAPGHGRIGLHQMGQGLQADVVLLGQLQDGQGHALGRGQHAAGLEGGETLLGIFDHDGSRLDRLLGGTVFPGRDYAPARDRSPPTTLNPSRPPAFPHTPVPPAAAPAPPPPPRGAHPARNPSAASPPCPHSRRD